MIEITHSNNKNAKCFCCNMPAETKLRIADDDGNGRLFRMCSACEYQMYIKLHEFRQKKLSHFLKEHTGNKNK